MPKARMLLTILGTAALVAAPVSIVPAFVGFDAAYAKNGGEGGKGNGGGNGNGGDRGNSGDRGNAGKSGEAGGKKSGSQSAASTGETGVSGKSKGKPTVTAAETTKKSNRGSIASQLKGLNAAHASAQAFANASPNSKVGQLRAYAEANNAALAAEDAAAAAAAEVARLAGLTPEEAALEFPDPVGYDQAAYDSALAEAQAAAEISGDLTEVERLQNLSAEERATSYPSDWDPAAAQAEAVAEATAAQAAADAAAAEALEQRPAAGDEARHHDRRRADLVVVAADDVAADQLGASAQGGDPGRRHRPAAGRALAVQHRGASVGRALEPLVFH